VGEFLTLSRKGDRHKTNNESIQQNSLLVGYSGDEVSAQEKNKRKVHDRGKRMNVMNIPSPILEIDSATVEPVCSGPPVLIPQTRITMMCTEPLTPKKVVKSPSIISRISSAGSNKSVLTTPEVWKTVLNDVSLQAARITFNGNHGASPSNKNGGGGTNENICDTDEHEPDNEDVFSQTYQQAKSRYMLHENIISLYDYPHETITNFPCQISRGSLF
jgi:hypothetical protein